MPRPSRRAVLGSGAKVTLAFTACTDRANPPWVAVLMTMMLPTASSVVVPISKCTSPLPTTRTGLYWSQAADLRPRARRREASARATAINTAPTIKPTGSSGSGTARKVGDW